MDGTVVLSFRLPVWCPLFGHFSCSCLLSVIWLHTSAELRRSPSVHEGGSHRRRPAPTPTTTTTIFRTCPLHTLHSFAHQQRIALLRLKTPLQYAQIQSTPYHTLHHTNESVYFFFHNATR